MITRSYTLTLTEDKFNSAHFGKRMGNLHLSVREEQGMPIQDALQAMMDEAGENAYDHLTCKIPTHYKDIVHAFEQYGFLLVDTLIVYVFEFCRCKLTDISHRCVIRDALPGDRVALSKIAHDSFSIDRFHSDPSLADDLCDAYYQKWIENSLDGYADRIIVAEHDDTAIGFTTFKLSSNCKYAEIVLSAVDSSHRGFGAHTSMLHEGVRWLRDEHEHAQRYERIAVGTQINNIAVQRAWNKLGFLVSESHYVFQKALTSPKSSKEFAYV